SPELISAVKDQFGLDESKAADTIDTSKQSLEQSITDEVKGGNVEGLLSMFNTGASITSNPTFQTILGKLNSDYIQKLGLSPAIASKIASYVLPLILQKITGAAGGKLDQNSLGNILGSGFGDIVKGKAGG